LKGFEKWKIEQGKSINTVSVYLRSMSTIFTSGMRELNKRGMKKIISENPFDEYKIKSEKTKKRNLDIEIIKAIRDYIPENEFQEVARDMFMLIFYLIGINTIDLFWHRGLV
jgi:hypothetical protein